MNKSSALLLAGLLLVSCSKVDKAMNATTSLDKKTGALSDNTAAVKENAGTMYEQFRSKESEEARARKFAEIIDDKAPKASRFGTKSNNAVIYYEAMEFQLWTGSAEFDTAEKRQEMFEDASNEFTRRLCDLYDVINTKKMSPTKDIKGNNEEFAFYALAIGMHFEHGYQKAQSKDAGFKEITFYDIVKKALMADYKKQNMESHLGILVQGVNKEIMIELLKARVDMISALAVKNLTDKRKMTLGQTLKAALFKASFGHLGGLDLPETFSKNNQQTNDRVIELLDGANKTKEFLASIGVAKTLDKNLRSVFQNIDLEGDSQESSAFPKQASQRNNIQILINNLMN